AGGGGVWSCPRGGGPGRGGRGRSRRGARRARPPDPLGSLVRRGPARGGGPMRARPHAGPVPQPALDRMVPFAGHAVVVGVVPGGHPLVVRTAAAWAAAADGRLVAAYADTSRHVVAEHADGSVTHAPLDPDHADDAWQDAEARLPAEGEE